jgi:UDP-2,3-diacylglucosamine pyrophosphatase LpxH
VFQNDQIRLLILHGDQFDTIVTEDVMLTNAVVLCYQWIQKLMPHRTSRWLRVVSKRFQRNSRLVMDRAVDYARSKGFRFVTCGHTHLALENDIQGVRYVNSGSWTDVPPCPFVAVKGNSVRLEYWPKVAPIVDTALEPAPLPSVIPLPALG